MPAIFMPIQLRFPSNYVVWIIFFIAYIPNILFPILSTRVLDIGMLIYALCVFAGMICLALIPKRTDLRFWHLGMGEFRLLLIVPAVSILAIDIAIFGFPTKFLSLWDIYSRRRDFTEELKAAGFGIAYMNPILTNILLPSIVYIGLVRKEMITVLASIFLYILLFNITTSKGVLFTPIFLIGFYAFTKIKSQNKPFLLTSLIIFVSLFTFVIDEVIFKAPILTGLTTMRLLIVQGLLTGMVQDYFHSHDFYYYSYSFLSRFVDAGHVRSLPEAIGINYLWRNWETHANVNFWANAYANLGYFGILFISLVFAGMLWLYDSIWYSKPRNLGSILLGLLAISVSNTGLHTVILSNGLWFAFVLGSIVPFSTQIRTAKMFPSIRVTKPG